MRALFLALLVWLCWINVVQAEASLVASTGSARTIPKDRLELSLFQPWRYGVTDTLELSAQPLMFLVPQLEAKVAWWSQERVTIGTRQRISYPTPLLKTVAKEGSFGLLPKTSKIPQAIILDLEALLTLEVAPSHLLTAWMGGSVAPRGSADNMPLLDFPFLYSRFAVLKTTAVYRLGVDYSGQLGRYFRIAADFKVFVLPVVAGGYSFEPGASLRWLLAKHVALEGGGRLEFAKFPAGNQFHYLPYVDVLLAW